MHELSIAQSILQAALDEARRVGGKRIRQIHATVREPSHHIEDPSSLEFCLQAIAEGTIAEGAEIGIELIPPTLRCKECDFNFLAEGSILFCPRCRGGKLEELDAEEIRLENMLTE